MYVKYHDDLVLVSWVTIYHSDQISISRPKGLVLIQRGKSSNRKKLHISFYFILAVGLLWIVQEPYSTHPTTSYVMSAHPANTPTYLRLLCSHIALAHWMVKTTRSVYSEVACLRRKFREGPSWVWGLHYEIQPHNLPDSLLHAALPGSPISDP